MAGKNNRDFFSQSKNQFGENFLNFMNPRDLQFRAPQIFRQMARGQIDVVENGKYFLDEKFLEALIVASNSKLVLHSISRDGVGALINMNISGGYPVSNDMDSVFDYHKRAAEAYGMINNAMYTINNTHSVDCLIPLVQNLSNFRDFI